MAATDDALSTYRHVRLAMVVLLALLFVAIVTEAVSEGCFAGSISAYYFTPVRAVFVATLCAVGVSLIAFQGRTDGEDIALNISGFWAFVVAFVPTGAPGPGACSATNVPSDQQIEDAIHNNMGSLFFAALLAVAIAWFLLGRPSVEADSPVVRSLFAFFALLVAGRLYFQQATEHFLSWAHLGAAGIMFAGMTLVVGMNGWAARPPRWGGSPAPSPEVVLYWRLFLVMVGSAVVLGGPMVVGVDLSHGALVLEAVLLAEFGVFWLLHTRSHWRRTAEPATTSA